MSRIPAVIRKNSKSTSLHQGPCFIFQC